MMASSINTCAESMQSIMTKSKLPGSESRVMTVARTLRVTNSRDTTCLQRLVTLYLILSVLGDCASYHCRSAAVIKGSFEEPDEAMVSEQVEMDS
jgi:hypothetical protein